MSYYLGIVMVKYYYDQIKVTGSLENAVDNFWNACLPNYFTQAKLYGIEQEQRPLHQVKQRADFTIRYIKNGTPKKVALFEDKRRGTETQPAEWVNALEQLTTYLKLVRTEQGGNDVLYGNLTLGTYCRFYELRPYEQTMRDFVEQAAPLELAADEKKIHDILNRWVVLTSH